MSPGNIEEKIRRKENRFLALVRRYPGISRQSCAQKMGISTFNISRLAQSLLERNLIVEGETTSGNNCGRPSTPLLLNPEYQYFAGIDLEAEYWRFVIIDFRGNLIHSQQYDFCRCASRTDYIEQLSNLLTQAIDASGEHWEKVNALGVGAPGFVDHETGIVENYEILPDFKRIPLLDICTLVSGKPSFITNNILCLATRSLWKKDGTEHKVLIHAAIRSGISTAFNIRDNVFYGRNKQAGELGLFLVDGAPLQESAGLSVLKRRLPNLDQDFWHGTPEQVKQGFRSKKIKTIITKAMEQIATCLANAAAFMDNDEIIVYSTLFKHENLIWEILRNAFVKYRKLQGLKPLKITRCGDSEFYVATGAALYALDQQYLRKTPNQA